MVEKAFNELRALILSLTKDELRVIKSYLIVFKYKMNKSNPKSITLINAILDNKSIKSNELMFLLYNQANTTAFRKLCHRLRDKILESLILEVNTTRPGYISALGKATIEANKLHLKILLCFTKGNAQLGLSLINRLLNLSKKHQLYDEQIKALDLKQRALGLRFGSKRYNKIANEMTDCEYAKQSVRLANQYLGKLFNELKFKNSRPKKLSFLVDATKDLAERHQKSQSKEVFFLWKRMEIEHLQEQKDYSKSNALITKTLKYICSEPIIYKKRMEGGLLMNLALNHTFLNQIEEALNCANAALPFFKENSYNYYQLQEVCFYAHYYSGRLSEAFQIAIETERKPKAQKTPLQQSKWNYWLGVCLFNQGRYAEAEHLLAEGQELKKDRKGWNMSIRILHIVALLEVGKHNAATQEVDTLRNFYYSNPHVRKRENSILHLLLKLQGHWDFNAVYQKEKDLLKKLSTAEKYFRFEIQTPELFLFDQWFMSKLKKKTYSPSYRKLFSSKLTK